MAYTINQVCNSAGASCSDNNSIFYAVNGSLEGNGTRISKQITYNQAGVFSFGGCYVLSNDVSLASTCAIEVNAVADNLSISITANTTGLFVNESNTTTIVATDKVNWVLTVPAVAGAHAVKLTNTFCRFNASTNTFQKLSGQNTTEIAYATTTQNFFSSNSLLTIGTTETNTSFTYRSNGTLCEGFARLTSNTRDSVSTLNSRIAGSNGTIAVSITASTSGIFEDIVHTDAVSAGQLIDFAITGTAGTGTNSIWLVGLGFLTTNKKSHCYETVNTGVVYIAATTYYFGLTGGSIPNLNTTEAYCQYKSGFSLTASNLQIYLSANAATGNGTFDFRIGSVSKTQTISVTAATTGLFEDTTHSDAVVATNLVNYRFVVGSGGNSTVTQVGCMIEDTTPAATGYPHKVLGVTPSKILGVTPARVLGI